MCLMARKEGIKMLHFLIKLPLRVLAFSVWLVVSVINTFGMFLVGLASWIFYLIAGVAVIAALGCVGFQLYTWQEVKMHLLCAAVFILIPNIGMWIITGTKLLQCGLRSFIFE